MTEIKEIFFSDTLKKHGAELQHILLEAIGELQLYDTGDLVSSLTYSISGSAASPILHFEFYGYGRAIEIHFHKRSNNTMKFISPNTNQSVWNLPENTRKFRKKKDTRWYSKNVYGSLNHLIGTLMYGLDDYALQSLKSKINPASI